jgi:endoglucanase
MSLKKTCYMCLILLFVNSACLGERNLTAFEVNEKLGRGINLGNALEAPKEGQWGVTLQEEYFKLIKQAGFESVRIPIKWSAHALQQKPYTIDVKFFDRVDWAVKNALSNNLCVVMNMHHYDEICDEPEKHLERFVCLWEQIAEHYKEQNETVLFELLNEPCKKLDDEIWNQLVADTLQVVRKSNPERIIVIGPTNWNSIDKLDKLVLPDSDRNIIVSFHYYQPFNFTHQGASWVGEQSKNWLGTKWTGTKEEKGAIEKDLDSVLEWGKGHNRPIYLGEFGAYSKADMPSRARWTTFVAREAEKRNFSWSYWEFCAGFGVYDSSEKKWREPLLKSLIPEARITDN